jgi:hypothetical protein
VTAFSSQIYAFQGAQTQDMANIMTLWMELCVIVLLFSTVARSYDEAAAEKSGVGLCNSTLADANGVSHVLYTQHENELLIIERLVSSR